MSDQLIPFVESELKKFEIKEEDLQALADQYALLKVEGVDDKAGLKSVYDARQVLKKKRIEIKNKGKLLRQVANDFQKAVIAREDELIGIIEPIEQSLKEEEERIEAEKLRLKKEAEEAEAIKIQDRIDKLSSVEYGIDYNKVRALSDEDFDQLLKDATEYYEQLKEQKRIQDEENARIEAEEVERRRKEEEELRRIAQEEELARKKAEEEREILRKKLEEAERKIKEANEAAEKERKEKETRERLLQEAKEAAERRKREEIEAKEREERLAKEREEQLEREKKEAAERALKQAEEERIRKEEEEKELVRLGDDMGRFNYVKGELDTLLATSVSWREMSSVEGKKSVILLLNKLEEARNICKSILQ